MRDGRHRLCPLFTGIAAALIASLCFTAGYLASHESALLLDTAIATSLALLIAAAIGAFMLLRTAGAYVAPATALRVVGTLIAVSVFGWFIPYFGKLWVLPLVFLVTSVTILLLVITRELGKQDLTMVKSVLQRKSSST